MQVETPLFTLSSLLHEGSQIERASFSPRRPESTLLYQAIQENWLSFLRAREEEGRTLPTYIKREFEDFIQCGILANGFMRLKCDACRNDKLIAFSCKHRGFCPSCAGRRMSESAAFFMDRVLLHELIRQWVFSFPIPLRFWMAKNPKLMTRILTAIIRVLFSFQTTHAKNLGIQSGQGGSITLIQRFGDGARLNIHFHILVIEGVYQSLKGQVVFHKLPAPSDADIQRVLRLLLEVALGHTRQEASRPTPNPRT